MQKQDVQPQKFTDITPDQIAEWKDKYGEHNIFQIAVESKPEEILGEGDTTDTEHAEPRISNFVILRPTRTIMDVVTTHVTKKDMTTANRTLIKGCVLGGDMYDLEKDGGVYEEVLEKIGVLVHRKTSTLKKL